MRLRRRAAGCRRPACPRAILPLEAARIGKLALIGPEADVIKDGGGSSAIDEFKLTTPKQGIEARIGASKVVHDDGSDAARAAEVAREADVAVVVVGDRMTEGSDKACMGLGGRPPGAAQAQDAQGLSAPRRRQACACRSAIAFTNTSSCLVVQHSNTPSQCGS